MGKKTFNGRTMYLLTNKKLIHFNHMGAVVTFVATDLVQAPELIASKHLYFFKK